MALITPNHITHFWFTAPMNKHWFKSTPEIDLQIRNKYAQTWQDAFDGKLNHWKENPESCLALILLLDQFPLNMFRGDPKCFASESISITLTLYGIAQNYDSHLSGPKLSFFYMPLMHSELLEHQNLSIEKFESTGLEANTRFAKHHQKIIQQFGRFPHRNKILGRESTTAELNYLNSKEAFTG